MRRPAPLQTRARHSATRARAGRGAAVWVLGLGATGGLLLIATEPATVAAVEIPGRACREIADLRALDRCELSGFERHGGALLLLGAVAVVLSFGAGPRASRPAASALLGIAVVALALGVLRDLPEVHATGAVGLTYEGATGRAGSGLYTELAGALLLVGAGALSLASGLSATRRRARARSEQVPPSQGVGGREPPGPPART